MNKTFEEFYNGFGLDDYPFSVYTAENEESEKLFLKPHDFSLLENTFKKGQSMIINGDRGTGKTIIIKELKRTGSQGKIVCFIDDYAEVELKNNSSDYYKLFIKHIVNELILYLISNKKIIKDLSKENKILLSYLIYKYGDNVSENQIRERIEAVQLTGLQRLINFFSKPITAIANYGATAITEFGNELLTSHFGKYLPKPDEVEIKKIFPDIKFKTDSGFVELEASYELMLKIFRITKQLKINKILVLIDKLDEDLRLENDSEEITSFIEPLFLENKLLLNNDIQLVICVWRIPFKNLDSKFRRNKHFVYDITWNHEELKSVLNHRLEVFSNFKVRKWEDLFEETSNSDIFFRVANSNPRDLWLIFHDIFLAQYRIDPSATHLSDESIIVGIRNFVSEFDFYEYYPKLKNARKNTNDIYSYIQHLLKLKSSDFTHSELKEMANTGGSTGNYITGMMKIGAIEKTSAKRDGGSVIYLIKDPKINYAIENGIDIKS